MSAQPTRMGSTRRPHEPSGAAARTLLPNPWLAVLGIALRTLRAGEVTVELPSGREHVFRGQQPGPTARVELRDPAAARGIALGGGMGLAEAYIAGAWDTPDLDAVLDVGAVNLLSGWAAAATSVTAPLERLRHARRDNDADGGARQNIAEHYDLSNDFYELWLDDTMTYSSACLAGDETLPLTAEQLECAQRRKWDRMLELIQPSSRDHVLEIGCGWGGFAIHLAKQAGCRVTGITLSEQQAILARERVRVEGLEDAVDIRLEDYRTIRGRFDGIASIEMLEAVGMKWWPVFFERLRSLLEPGSAAALQSITIAEERFDDYRRNPDFTQRHIFPGGMLPSPERLQRAAESAGFTVGEPRFFGKDYAQTIAAWGERFEQALPDVRALGFDERFIRTWRYYLAFCRAGFEHGSIDVMQVRLDS